MPEDSSEAVRRGDAEADKVTVAEAEGEKEGVALAVSLIPRLPEAATVAAAEAVPAPASPERPVAVSEYVGEEVCETEGEPERDLAAELDAEAQRDAKEDGDTLLLSDALLRALADLPAVRETDGLGEVERVGRLVREALPPARLALGQRVTLGLAVALRGAEMEKVMSAVAVLVVVVDAVMVAELESDAELLCVVVLEGKPVGDAVA